MPNPIATTPSAISSHPHHGRAPSPESSVPVVDVGTTATVAAVLVCAGWVTVDVFVTVWVCAGWVTVCVSVFVGSVVVSAFVCAVLCDSRSVPAFDAASRACEAAVPVVPDSPEPHDET